MLRVAEPGAGGRSGAGTTNDKLQQTNQHHNSLFNDMKRKLKLNYLLATLAGLFLSLSTFAQQMTVKGHVKDGAGEPVIGANVLVKGSSVGVITDLDGNFTLSAKQGDMLVVTFVGYQAQEVKAAPSLTIVLKDDTQLLDDVVVIGYGTVKKTDLSGSVVAVKAEELNRGAITSPQELMQGKVPGLFVTPGDGQPGAGAGLVIRGGASLNAGNDPLIVIDGVPVAKDAAPGTPNALGTINPNDIESFTVLKDASATAIYGSRASNGVIIITTKKGTQDRIKVAYTGTFAVKDPYKRMQTLGADRFRELITKQYPASTATGAKVAELLNRVPDTATDWQSHVFQTGLSTDHNVSVGGKAGFLPFRVSMGYNTERGTLKTSEFDRFTGAVNLNPKFLDDHLSVDVNIKGSTTTARYANAGAVGAAAFYDPTKPVYSGTDAFNGYWNWTNAGGVPNSLASVNPLELLYDVTNKGTTKRSLGNVQIDYKIHGLEDLRANLNLGYDVASSTGSNFVAPGSFQSVSDAIFTGVGQGTRWNNLRRNHLLDFYLNYAKELPTLKSRFDVMAGYSWQHFYYANHDITYSNPTADRGTVQGYTYDTAYGSYVKDGHRLIPYENYLVSFFGRMNYSLMDRYLLTATLRRDGSSRFSENNRWGLFPSVALAWTVLNEDFMAPAREVLSNLKLRVGYGVTGQQEIGDYLYLPTYWQGTNPQSTYLGSLLLKPNGYSPDLKWEETATYNVGLDYGFLNNRIRGSIEFYEKHTKDLLNTVSAPAGTNFTNEVIANVGEMRNRGVEFNVNAMAIQTRDFSWELGYNITWNDSEITKLTATYNPEYPGIVAGTAPFGTNSVIQKHQVGQLPSSFWLYQQVYGADGRPVQNAYVDRNKDGQITEADRYFTGKSPMAKVFMGLSSQLTYKNWDLGFNLRANLGNYVFNAVAAGNATLASFGDQGFLTNYHNTIERTGFTQLMATEQRMTDYFLENASFLKMDNITLGYSFDKLFGQRLSGRLSASVQNVFTLTKYNGVDPETSAIDSNIWPRPRTFTLGLNLNF